MLIIDRLFLSLSFFYAFGFCFRSLAFAWLFRPVACLALCFQPLSIVIFLLLFCLGVLLSRAPCSVTAANAARIAVFSLARRLRERFPPSYPPPGNSSARPSLCLPVVGISLYYDGTARKQGKQPPPDRIAGRAPHRGGGTFSRGFCPLKRNKGVCCSATHPVRQTKINLISFAYPKQTQR